MLRHIKLKLHDAISNNYIYIKHKMKCTKEKKNLIIK